VYEYGSLIPRGLFPFTAQQRVIYSAAANLVIIPSDYPETPLDPLFSSQARQ
jgi:hypothetical protein